MNKDEFLARRGMPDELVRITPNGEITYDPTTKEYTVGDEIYVDAVCITPYEICARAALKAYGEHYL